MISLQRNKQRMILALLLIAPTSFAKIYLKVEGANVARGKLALGTLHALGTPKPALAKKVRAELQKDLAFTSLFDLVDEKDFAHLDKRDGLYTMNFQQWGLTPATFALKLGYKMSGDKLVMEALLYDVAGQEKILGTRYQYKATQYYKLVHTLTEDILKKLTGEKGLFNSRVLMICTGPKVKGKLTKEVFVVDPDGRNLTQLTKDKRLTLSPAWAADGSNISYTQYQLRKRKRKIASRGRKRVRTELKTVPVLKKHNLISGKGKIISERDGMNSGAAWSPDGQKLAVTLSFTGRPEIYLISSQGTSVPKPISRRVRIRRIAGKGFHPNYSSLLFDVEPAFSPDGNRMVFSSARTGHPMIYIADLKSLTATQLTFAGTYNSSPAWSPIGDRILFAAQRVGKGNFDLYAIDADGSNLSRLTKGGRAGKRRINNENPTWAPTGRHFAFASNESGKYAIYAMSLDGHHKRRISPATRECTTPSWGPYEG